MHYKKVNVNCITVSHVKYANFSCKSERGGGGGGQSTHIRIALVTFETFYGKGVKSLKI